MSYVTKNQSELKYLILKILQNQAFEGFFLSDCERNSSSGNCNETYVGSSVATDFLLLIII